MDHSGLQGRKDGAFALQPPPPREAAGIAFTSIFLATAFLAAPQACCSIAVNMLFFSRCFCLQYSLFLVRRQREPTAAITPSVSLERKPARLLQAYLNLFTISAPKRDFAALLELSELLESGEFSAPLSDFSGCHAVVGQLEVFAPTRRKYMSILIRPGKVRAPAAALGVSDCP